MFSSVALSGHSSSDSHLQLMGRSLLLKCFSPEEQPPLLTDGASAFCSSLAEQLRKLEMSLAKDSISLKWSFEVMSLLKKMQRDLLGLLKKSKLPISYGPEEDWFDQYMKDSATLLDFCNSLKTAVSGINRYRMVVDVAVQKLGEESSSGVFVIQKLELERRGEKFVDVRLVPETLMFGTGRSSGKGTNGADEKVMSISALLLVAKTTMIILSLLLVSAMIYPISIDMATAALSSEYPELNLCLQSLDALVGTFYERIPGRSGECGALLVEHEMVDEVLRELKSQVMQGVPEDDEEFSSGLQKLRTRSFELREGVDRFDAVVDEVFEEVVRGRNDMLEVFRNEV